MYVLLRPVHPNLSNKPHIALQNSLLIKANPHLSCMCMLKYLWYNTISHHHIYYYYYYYLRMYVLLFQERCGVVTGECTHRDALTIHPHPRYRQSRRCTP